MIDSKIAKNALVLMIATTGQKLVAFITFTIVARIVGVKITGDYFYAVSVTSIFVTFSDLGMTPVVIRAIAGGRQDADRLFGAAIHLKLILIPIAVAASIAYGLFRGNSVEIITTISIACIAMAADAFHLILYGALRGRQNLKPEAIGMFIGQTLTGIASITAALIKLGPIGLAFALAIGSLWNVGWALYNINRFQIKFSRPTHFNLKLLSKETLPFAIAGISVKVYSYIDSLMLEFYKGTTAVGYYAVAYKLTYAMQFLPLTFTAALYPALSAAYANKHQDELKKTFLGSLRLMATISFPISAGLSALAPGIITSIYGLKFAGSIPAMQVLPWVLLPIFMDFPVGALLNSSHRAHLKTIAMVVTMIINALLNLILVPIYGPLGAAWAGVGSFWSLLAVGMALTRIDVGGIMPILSILLRASIAATISWLCWAFLDAHLPFIVAFSAGAAISIILAFAVRLVMVQDIKPVWIGVKSKFFKQEQVHES